MNKLRETTEGKKIEYNREKLHSNCEYHFEPNVVFRTIQIHFCIIHPEVIFS
jgi:hypothetical protein